MFSFSACGSSDGKNGSGGKTDINIVDNPFKKDSAGKDNDEGGQDNNESDNSISDDNISDTEENNVDEVIYTYFSVDTSTDFFYMDTSFLGVSYSEFTKKLSYCELTPIEDWPWWGKNLEIVYVTYDDESYSCLFQNRKLVYVYRDSKDEKQGKKYSTAVSYYGEPSSTSDYWSGSKDYIWNLDGCHYQQHVEIYSEGDGHYRQQYVSNAYVE